MGKGRLLRFIAGIIGIVLLLGQTSLLARQHPPAAPAPAQASINANPAATVSAYLPLVRAASRPVTLTPGTATVIPGGLVLGAPTGALTEALTLRVGAPPAQLPALPAGVSIVDTYELSAATPLGVSGDVPLVMGFPYNGDDAALRVALLGQFPHREEPTWVFSDLYLDPATNLAVLLWYGIEQPVLTFALVRDERAANAAASVADAPRRSSIAPAQGTLANTFQPECDTFSFAEGAIKSGTDRYPDCLVFELQLAEWMESFNLQLLSQGFRPPQVRRNAQIELPLPGGDVLVVPAQPTYIVDIASSASAECTGVNGRYSMTIRKLMVCFDTSKPIADRQTTAAHELFHAVQASYLNRTLFVNPYSDWFLEGTATLAGATLARGGGRTPTLDPNRRVRRLSEPLYNPSDDSDNYRAQRFWRVALEQAPEPALTPLIGVMEQIAPLRSEYAFVYGTDSALNGLGEPYAAWVAADAFAGCGFREAPPSVDNYLTIRTSSHNSSDPEGPRVPTTVLNSSAYRVDLDPSAATRLVVASIVRGPNDDRPLGPIAYFRTDAKPICSLHKNSVELTQMANKNYRLYATISDPNLPTGVSASDTGEAQIVFEPLDVTLAPDTATTYRVDVDTTRSVLPRLTLWSTAHEVNYEVVLDSTTAGTNPGVISFDPDAAPTGNLNAANNVQELPLQLDCRGRSAGSVYAATLSPTITSRDGIVIQEGVPAPVDITVECVAPEEPIPSCSWRLITDNQTYSGSFAAYTQTGGFTYIQLRSKLSDPNPDVAVDIGFPGPPRAGTIDLDGEGNVFANIPPFTLIIGDGTEGSPPPPTLLIADRSAVEIEGRIFGQFIRLDASSGEIKAQTVNAVIEFAARELGTDDVCGNEP